MSLEEFLARVLTARKMKMTADPQGVLLPDDLWRRRLPEAQFIVGALHAYELRKAVLSFHMAADEDDGE
jgi:hypothetical protein